jgi:DNA gyrase subunit A
MYPATMHNYMLFFTQKGKCFWLRVYELPEGSKNSKGRAIQNLLNIDPDDTVTAFVRVKELEDLDYLNSNYLIFSTKRGVVKKTLLEAYSRPRQNGVIAITLREDDEVISVRMTNGTKDVLLANRNGRAIRFKEENVRPMGRTASGVIGMRLDGPDDEVIGMITMDPASVDTILVVSEKGYGKRTRLNDDDGEPVYRITNRGGKGVRTLNVTDKTGKLVSIKSVSDNNDLMIINKSGITIRLNISDIRTMGRATQGVRLINLDKRNDEIASVCKVNAQEDEEEIEILVDDIGDLTNSPKVDIDTENNENSDSSSEIDNETED